MIYILRTALPPEEHYTVLLSHIVKSLNRNLYSTKLENQNQ
jgi:hypothetical protein